MTTDSNPMDPASDYVTINPGNISKYGFVCFHQPDECKIEDGFWAREAEINVGGKQGSFVQKFRIPEDWCVELIPGKKIADFENFEIASSSGSVDAIALLLQRSGWNQTREDLEAITHQCQQGSYVATYNFLGKKIPLGSGVSLPINDRMCWIGMILVHPELRRQGIARSIMNACLKHARFIQNKSIVGLDATPLGKQVYDSLGFKDSFTIWRSVINSPCDESYNNNSDHSLIPFDLMSAKKYLLRVSYDERINIIKLLASLPQSKNYMVIDGSEIRGIVLSRPGRLKPFIGPLIADSKATAYKLLEKTLNEWNKCGHETVLMDIPEWHFNDSIFYIDEKTSDHSTHQVPIKPIRSFARMYQVVTDSGLMESSNDKVTEKALNSHDETVAFMQKEKDEIVPIIYGTSGPEWS